MCSVQYKSIESFQAATLALTLPLPLPLGLFIPLNFLKSNSFKELAKCHQDIPCGQSDVSNYLAFRHILKSIVKELNEKVAKMRFLELESSLSVHM